MPSLFKISDEIVSELSHGTNVYLLLSTELSTNLEWTRWGNDLNPSLTVNLAQPRGVGELAVIARGTFFKIHSTFLI